MVASLVMHGTLMCLVPNPSQKQHHSVSLIDRRPIPHWPLLSFPQLPLAAACAQPQGCALLPAKSCQLR